MKKIIFLVFTVMTFNAFAISLSVGGGMHIGGKYVTEKPNQFELAALYLGFTPSSLENKVGDFQSSVPFINLEVTQGFVIGEVGAGVSYEQGYERADGVSYNAIPVYGLVKLNLFPILIKPYIAAKYGTIIYNGLQGVTSIEKPVFYSLGLGITVAGKITVEATGQGSTYQINGVDQGSATYGLTGRYTF